MALPKPKSVEANEFKSQKWDELTSGRDFPESAIPQLALLCHWYAVAEQCMEDVTYDDRIQIAYSNEHDDVKALPHHAKLKEASAEIRAINKQLGIVDQLHTEQQKPRETPLNVIQTNRFARAFDYQSECHCTKTSIALARTTLLFDYQSECHCTKTGRRAPCPDRRFDYQSECHCTKTSTRTT